MKSPTAPTSSMRGVTSTAGPKEKPMKRMLGVLGSLALAVAVGACGHSQPTAPKYSMPAPQGGASGAEIVVGTAAVTAATNVAAAGSVKGAGGEMPAYYDDQLLTINSVEISETAADQVGSNPSHNEIFVTNDLDDPQDFIPVIDAIQGDGFNPLWEQILVVFNPGVTPRQFLSDDEVEQAAAVAHPEITLVDTHEVYRCSVVGKK